MSSDLPGKNCIDPERLVTVRNRTYSRVITLETSGSKRTRVTMTAMRKNIQRGNAVILVTMGQAAQAIRTPTMVSRA